MELFNQIFLWLQEFFAYGVVITQWLITPINLAGWVVYPLALVSIGGLTAFIPIAFIKWSVN